MNEDKVNKKFDITEIYKAFNIKTTTFIYLKLGIHSEKKGRILGSKHQS